MAIVIEVFRISSSFGSGILIVNHLFILEESKLQLDTQINDISRIQIDTWHKNIGKNNGIYMANRCLALIRHMLNMAINWGFITTNNATHIKQFKEVARDRFLQPDEIHNFINALQTTNNLQLKH